MQMTEIIGFTGNKGSGKSEAARQLVNHVERTAYDVVNLAFADKIKDISKDVYGLDEKQVNGELKEEVDPRWAVTPREIMQSIGQSFRGIHPETWIRYTKRRAQESDAHIVVIDDVRYPNEANMIEEDMNGAVIGIIRPGNDVEDDHESETQLQKHWDEMTTETIVNDGTIEELRDYVVSYAHEYAFEV